MKKVVIKGTDEYRKSKYYGKAFDDSVIVKKYTHDYEEDEYIIEYEEK